MANAPTEDRPFLGPYTQSTPNLQDDRVDGSVTLELGNGHVEDDRLTELRALTKKVESNPIDRMQGSKPYDKIRRIAKDLPNAIKYYIDMLKLLNKLKASELPPDIKEQFEGTRKLYASRLGSVIKWICIVVVALLLVMILAVVFYISNSHTSQDTCKDPNDLFKPLSYQSASETVWIKYNVSTNPVRFAAAKERCKNLGAELWEVLDGKPEWDVMIAKLKAIEEEEMEPWIGGEIEDCPPVEKCDKQDAENGHGIPMKRSQPLRYSRLYGDKNENTCVAVNEEGLWLRRSCNLFAISVCVLRACKAPPQAL